MRTSLALIASCAVALVVTVTGAQRKPAAPVREFITAKTIDSSPGASANIAAGDLDGDGDLDLVIAKGRHWESVDRVLINNGHGEFTARNLGTAQDSSYSAIPADVDGDGDLDVVVSNDSEPGLVYANDGTAHFQPLGQWGAANWPTRFATIADFNGDGRPDVVAANRGNQPGRRSRVCLNDGHGQMTACTELAVGPASGIAAADFNRDGFMDLAVPFRDGGQSVILYNDGKAGFTKTVPFGPNTATASAVAAGDLNGDGWPDLVVGDENVSAFIYLNDGRGGLQPGLQLKFDELAAPRSIAIGDLNRDGYADIVVGYYTERGSVLFNDGTGRSFRHVRFGDGLSAVYGLALGDFDGDGAVDIATARNDAPSVIYFNRPGPGVEVIATSDHPSSPVRALQPFKDDSGKLGVWRGDVIFMGYRRALEVRIDNVTKPGPAAGQTNQMTAGVPYCRTSLTFKERKADGTYVFSEDGWSGCTGPMGTAQARWLDDGRLQWELRPEGIPANLTGAVGTLERAGAAIPFLTPMAGNPSTPVVGTWRGDVHEGDDTYGVETRIERLVVGETAGQQLFYSPSPTGRGETAWCVGPLVLKEVQAGGTYVFTKRTDRGSCGNDEFRAKLGDADHLQLGWYWSRGIEPDASATLERKR